MLKVINANDLTNGYQELLHEIMQDGDSVSPRGMRTKEIHPCIMVLHHPENNLIFSPARAINPLFMLSEFVWIMSGLNDVEFVSKYNKAMGNFSDDGNILNGAYGPRIREFGRHYHYSKNHDREFFYKICGVDQLNSICEKLKKDPDTRQAVIAIFNPYVDHQPTKDVPCNIFLKFTLREGALDLTAYVRSQDMILGFPYDVYHWTTLQQVVAKILNVELGAYYHIMDSAHIYEKDFKLAWTIADEDSNESLCKKVDTNIKTLAEFDALLLTMQECIKTEKFDLEVGDVYFDDVIDMFRMHHTNERKRVGAPSDFMILLNDYKKKRAAIKAEGVK